MDEAKEVLIARGLNDFEITPDQRPLRRTLDINKFSVLQPPLMCALLHYWSNISCSIPWLRILPLIFCVLALLLMYYSSRLIGFSVLWSLAIVAFCSLSYAWFFMSLYVRAVYSFTIFSSVLSIFLITRIIKNKAVSLRDYVILGLGMSLACFSHYGFWFLIPFLLCVILALIMRRPAPLKDKLRNAALVLVPVCAALGYIISQQTVYYREFKEIAVLQFFGQNGLIRLDFSLVSNSLRLVSAAIFWQLTGIVEAYHNSNFLNQVIYAASLVFIIACIRLLVVSIKTKDSIPVFIISAFLCGAVSCGILPFLRLAEVEQIRYTIFFSPYLILSFFIGAHFLYQYYARRFQKIAYCFIAVFLVLCLSNAYCSYRYRAIQYGFADIRGLLKQVKTDITESDSRYLVYVNCIARDIFRYHYIFTDTYLSRHVDKNDIYLASYRPEDAEGISEVSAYLRRVEKKQFGSILVMWGFLPNYDFIRNDNYYKIKAVISSMQPPVIAEELKSNRAMAFKLTRQIL